MGKSASGKDSIYKKIRERLPELKPIFYDPNSKLQDVKLPEGYTWINPEIIPCVKQSSYAVVYNPNEEKYNPITFDLNLEVKKKVLTIAECVIPSDLYVAVAEILAYVYNKKKET